MNTLIYIETPELSSQDMLNITGGDAPNTDAVNEYYYNKGRCFVQNIVGFFQELF